MAQYLVTGGAGFIGSHLAEELMGAGTASEWLTRS
jgi:nucleoside-diphosphate-sugar epimerase